MIAPSVSSPSVEAICVNPKDIHQVWPFVRTLVAKAMERGGITPISRVEHDLSTGGMLLWLAWGTGIEGVAVTELVNENARKLCVIVACGGKEISRWLHLIGRIEQFARDENCEAMRIMGREGWAKMLPDYRRPYVVLEKRL